MGVGGAAAEDNCVARTVLIVDDHPGFRAMARLVLQEAGFDVVGEAGDGRSALASARALRPAVVLLDVNLPDLEGFAVAAELAREREAPTVVMTSSRDGRDLEPLLRASAVAGFVPKERLSPAALRELLG
jgi:DNA-binding NarL/FixJ family response regulator